MLFLSKCFFFLSIDKQILKARKISFLGVWILNRKATELPTWKVEKTIVYFVESFTIFIIFLNLITKNINQETGEIRRKKIVCDSNSFLRP